MSMPLAPAAPDILKGRKILAVDDDRLNLRILRGILQGDGYHWTEVDSAEAALERYAEVQPDLVLLDVVLPGMNGFAACRELRHRFGDNVAPVIFITARQDSEDVLEGFNAGGVDYIVKPFAQKEVVARIRTHVQLRALIDHQKSLVDQLSRANASKNKFLGMAAHDLRNPLSSIRGITEFLTDGIVGELTPDQRELVDTIHSASSGMLALVNNLLDVATIESGELKLDPRPASLAEIVEKSIAINAHESTRKRTRISLAPHADLPLLSFDPDKIRQVVDNLLSNAIKYSPPGSLVRVSLEALPHGAQIVCVRDQGPGIPDNERDRLFKDFSRLSARPTGGEKSTGLGLAICRKIMEAHRGVIRADNHPEGGCEFRIFLPPPLVT